METKRIRQGVGTKCGDEAYPTKRGDKVRGQGVSAKHPLKPTLNLTLNRHAYFTRLIFRSARAAQRFYPLNCEPLSGRNNGPSKKTPLRPERARYASPGQRPGE